MAKIPINMNTTRYMLDNMPAVEEKPRDYLGMSSLGGECLRKLWYGFRLASKKKTDARLIRIYERGDIEEYRIIRDLKKIGLKIFRRDEENKEIEIFGTKGEKQEQIIGFAGHAKGHLDGRALGVIEAPTTEHLLEMKTMNDARWKSCDKNGVQVSDPVYYSQMQRYMDGKELTRALYVATNKNDEKMLTERIHFDKNHARDLKTKEQDIIMSDSPQLWDKFSRSWHGCKGCSQYDVCQNESEPVRTCRSCEHVDLATEGKWLCGLNNDKELNFEDQKAMALCGGKSYRRLF